MMNRSCFLLVLLVFSLWQAGNTLTKMYVQQGEDGTVYVKSGVGKNIVIQPGYGGRVIINGRLQVCEADGCIAKLGSRRNPALSCKAILDDDKFAPSGVYYIKTNPYVTKVYCYMEYIPGCGGGGWTTIMKTNGRKPTFTYSSALWQNKVPYHVTAGQSGVDHLETNLLDHALQQSLSGNENHTTNSTKVDSPQLQGQFAVLCDCRRSLPQLLDWSQRVEVSHSWIFSAEKL